MKNISSQMLKGILQGIVLMILDHGSEYGHGLSKQMNRYGLNSISKGTIYPLLMKMEKNKLIEGKMMPSDDGPDRKYYFITDAGKEAKDSFINDWQQLQTVVNQLIDEEQ